MEKSKKTPKKFDFKHPLAISNIFLLFAFNIVFLFISTFASFWSQGEKADPSVGGWYVILGPAFSCFVLIPQCVGYIASFIAFKKNKITQTNRIIIFVCALLSLITTIFTYISDFFQNHNSLFWVALVSAVLLTTASFFKLIEKNED